MALPQLTATDRTDALARALVVRRERSELLTSLKEGRVTLSELLSTQGDTVGKIPVRRLLEALPGIGKVRAARPWRNSRSPTTGASRAWVPASANCSWSASPRHSDQMPRRSDSP